MKEIKKELLTAYALGELSPTERAEIEEILKNNPGLQKEIEEIQNFGNFLSEELKAESLPQMTEESRGQFMDKAIVKDQSTPWWKLLLQGKVIPVGIIMTAFLGLVVFFTLQQEMLRENTESIGDQAQGFETSIAVGEGRANKPQVIPRERQELAPNGSIVADKSSEDMVAAAPPVKAKPSSKRMRSAGKGFSERKKEAGAVGIQAGIKDSMYLAEMDSEESLAGSNNSVVYGSGRGRLMQKKSKRMFRPDDANHGGYRVSPQSGDSYENVGENSFVTVSNNPLSTFSIDVDTASYTNIRRYLTKSNMLPPSAAVRIEEMINYFNYQDSAPKGKDPFSVNLEVAESPWSEGHKLVRIGIKGKVFPEKNHKTNLVFLVDVSGSMDTHDKIGLLKEGLHKLLEELGEDDHVSLVTYAGNSAVVLDSTSANQKKKIHQAIDNLTAGGSTHGSKGITTAYELAQKNFRKEGVNRVILATDGDFNVGTTSDRSLVDLVKAKAQNGVFLSVLGFGSGNLNDSMMEKISNKGNGNYFYIDSEKEARKVLVDKLQGTLVTIAKDVKIQVEFNPNNVSQYRLIGYENRKLAAKDFNDDKKDAGEIGAGHTVVALYEIKPAGFETKGIDPLRYQSKKKSEKKSNPSGKFSDELLIVKLRYKEPNGSKSKLLSFPVAKASRSFASASPDLRWTASVAGFGMMLKESAHKGSITYEKLIEWANQARWAGSGYDEERAELIELVKKAKRISGN